MTIEELSIELGVSVHYLQHHFPKVKRSWGRRGYVLIKMGRGASAIYGVIGPDDTMVRFDFKGGPL